MKTFLSTLIITLILYTGFAQSSGSGYGITFDGSNDHITVPNTTSTAPGTQLTFEAWVKPDASQSANIVMKGNYGWGVIIGSTGCASGLKLHYWVDDSCTNSIASTGSLTTGEWNHVAVVVTTSPAKSLAFYINGEDAGTSTSSTITIGSGSIGSLYIGSQGSGCACNYFDGTMDEVRLWNDSLTQAEIQEWMCKKITSSHTSYSDLGAYYKFDENTGSTAYDSSNTNNGTLVNSPAYALSGAPIGNESTYSYGSGNSTSLTETHSDGSSFKIDNFTGTPDGAHVYLVTDTPNTTTETLSGAIDSTRYYGTFVVGGTSPTYTVTYDYTGNTNITGGSESQAVLTSRADNAATSWSKLTNNLNLNASADEITLCETSGSMEYAGGFDAVLQERPGSGYALDFDGSNDYVVTNDIPELANASAVTYEAWIYVNGASWTDYMTLMSKEGGSGNRVQLVLSGSGQGGDNDLIAVVSNTSNNMNLNTDSDIIPYQKWTHVAMVFDGSLTGDANRLKLYVNGIQQTGLSTAGTGSVPATTPNTTADFYIGSRATSLYFDGKMDNVRVWDKALSETELRNNMSKKVTADDGNFCNLVADFRFDENTGSTLYDYAGGINGTLTNGPTYELSGAPIGDALTMATSVTSSTTLSLAHADGPQMDVDVTSGTADALVLYRIDEAPNVTTAPTGVTELSASHYYGVKAFGSSSLIYEVTYNYNGHEKVVPGNEDSLKLCTRADNSTSSWTKESATLNMVSNTLTLGSQTGTQFIMGSSNPNFLPIELSLFSAKRTSETVELSWTTESEINNDYFEIERSPNGSEWSELLQIDGAGNSSSQLTYASTDDSPLQGTSYYRLKQVDFNGEFSYSDVVQVAYGTELEQKIRYYPNPVKEILHLAGLNVQNDLLIVNVLGDQFTAQVSFKQLSESEIELDVSSLPNGLYYLISGEQNIKFLKE